MADIRAIALRTRPHRVAHLSFETSGFLQECVAELGTVVKAYDLAAFYGKLDVLPTNTADPSRLQYNFPDIEAEVKPFLLASLRKERGKSILQQLMNARSNAFLSKYWNGPAIFAKANELYSPTSATSKPGRLDILATLSQKQVDTLVTAYAADRKDGVVKTTSSDVQGTTAAGAATTSEKQTITNTDYGYRIPYLEVQAQNERAQISLMEQKFDVFMASQNLPFLPSIFWSELNTIDNNVFQAQIAFLGYFLTCPIDGIVTGKYKQVGEAVQAGETVYRVEDNSSVFIEASLVYRGEIRVGSKLSIKTNLFGSGSEVTLKGKTVTARMHSVEDRWEIVLVCENVDSAGKMITPLGYRFDYDDTTISIDDPGPTSR